MMYDLYLAWRTLRTHAVQAVIPALVMALSLALSIAVLALGDGARQGIIRASDPFGALVIGPKGDAQQLVLNTLLLQGFPLGTIPIEIYETLATDPRVRLAVPLAKGDNVAGAPVIGTNRAFFELRSDFNGPPTFQIARGRLFETDYEAVLGSRAAAALGLTLGDQFRAAHGSSGRSLASEMHQQIYTVVGILEPSNTVYDGAVYVTMETVWDVHGETDVPQGAVIPLEGQLGAAGRLTAVLAIPTGFIEQNELMREFYLSTVAQAAAPGAELGGLFDLLRQGERIMTTVGYLVVFIAALTVFLSIYNLTDARLRDIAVMRSLGGSRAHIFRIVVFQTLIIVLLGALLSRALGYGAALAIGAWYSNASQIPILIRFLPELEPLLLLLPIIVGLLAGLIPAVRAYSVDIVEHLFPT